MWKFYDVHRQYNTWHFKLHYILSYLYKIMNPYVNSEFSCDILIQYQKKFNNHFHEQ